MGDTALAVGDWREGSEIRSQVLEVKPATRSDRPDFLRSEDDASGITIRVRSCVRETASEASELSSYDWTAQDSASGIYELNNSSWDTWPPTPQYPVQRSVRPGDCIEGWVLLAAPDGTKPTRVTLGDGDSGVAAEWLVP